MPTRLQAGAEGTTSISYLYAKQKPQHIQYSTVCYCIQYSSLYSAGWVVRSAG